MISGRWKGHSEGPWHACHDGKCPCRQVWSYPLDAPVFTARGDKLSFIGIAHHIWGDGPKEMVYGEIPLEQTEANAKLVADATFLPKATDLVEKLLHEVIEHNREYHHHTLYEMIAEAQTFLDEIAQKRP